MYLAQMLSQAKKKSSGAASTTIASKREQKQSLTAAELMKKRENEFKEKEFRREAMKVDSAFDFYGGDVEVSMKPRAVDQLRRHPSFNFDDREPNPADLFRKIFTDNVIVIMIKHAFGSFGFEDAMAHSFSLRRVLLYMVQRIYVFKMRSTRTNTSQDDVLKKNNYPNLVFKSDSLDGGKGVEVIVQDYFFTQDLYSWYNHHLILPSYHLPRIISSNLRTLVNFGGCLVILDEWKREFHGHACCIRIIRGKPCLFLVENSVQVPNSTHGFCFFMYALDEKHNKSRAEIVHMALQGTGVGADSSPVAFDSYYATKAALAFLSMEGRFFICSVNSAWFEPELKSLVSYLVDEGNEATATIDATRVLTADIPVEPVVASTASNKSLIDDDDEYTDDIDQKTTTTTTTTISTSVATAVAAAASSSVVRKSTSTRKEVVSSAKAAKVLFKSRLSSFPPNTAATLSMRDHNLVMQVYWRLTRNTKSTAVSSVVTNMYTPLRAVKKTTTAAACAGYDALYSLGSDSTHSVAHATREQNARRGDGAVYVFSDMALHNILLSVWALMQNKGYFNHTVGTEGKSLMVAFEEFLDTLICGLLEHAARASDERIVPVMLGNSCPCGCESSDDEEDEEEEEDDDEDEEGVAASTIVTNGFYERVEALLEREVTNEETRVKKNVSQKKKSATVRKKSASKRQSLERNGERVAKKARALRKSAMYSRNYAAMNGMDSDEDEEEDENEEEIVGQEECDECRRMIDSDKLLGCENETCGRWLCSSCAGLKGRGVNSARNMDGWTCKYCEEEEALEGLDIEE